MRIARAATASKVRLARPYAAFRILRKAALQTLSVYEPPLRMAGTAMKPTLLPTLALALIAACSAPAFAQQATASAASAKPTAVLADGEVRKVDKENKKLTIRHGEIKNLDMPPMTMVFGVSPASLVDKVKAGDKIRFKAIDTGGGNLVVTEIQSAH